MNKSVTHLLAKQEETQDERGSVRHCTYLKQTCHPPDIFQTTQANCKVEQSARLLNKSANYQVAQSARLFINPQPVKIFFDSRDAQFGRLYYFDFFWENGSLKQKS